MGWLWLALLLAIWGLFISGTLLLEHHGQAGASAIVDSVCGPESDSGCHVVDRSAWSEIAGIPLAALGGLFYVSLSVALILAIISAEARSTGAALALGLCLLGLVVDLALLAIQAFFIRSFCALCLLTYVATLGAGAALLGARGALRAPRTLVALPSQRLLVAGWLTSSAVALFAVGAAEWALAAPSSPIQATGSLDETPVAQLSPEEARAELTRLRSVLSDPDRLEAYFAEKSLHEYETNPVHEVDLAGAQIAGPPNAPVRVVVYSDFLCPWCARLAAWMGQYVPSTGGKVSVAFRNYPLDRECNPQLRRTVHEGACHLARAGLCAQEQGRFWAFHDAAFSSGLDRATAADAMKIAGSIGLDMAAFRLCVDSPSTAARLAQDIDEARRVGVTATPSLLVNGRLLPRANDLPLVVQRLSQ